MKEKFRVKEEERLVWYVGYGSNLLKSRFLLYIKGGTSEINSKIYPGCIDPTDPRKDKSIVIPYELYFSKKSPSWEDKSVAFIKHERNNSIKTKGRMFLISEYQIRDVILQENSKDPNTKSIKINIEEIILNGFCDLKCNWYSRIVFLGYEDEIPIFAITATWDDNSIQINSPGDKYLITIAQGLRETYYMKSDEIIEYLKSIDGISGNIPEDEIEKTVKKALAL